MNKPSKSIWPPPVVSGLGLLDFGYHTCRKLIRIITRWDSFSFRTPYEAATNFLLLDIENNEYWAIAPISENERLLPHACVGFLYYVHDFKIVHVAAATNPIKTEKLLLFGNNTRLMDCVERTSINRYRFSIFEMPVGTSTVKSTDFLTDVIGVIRSVSEITSPLNGIQKLEIGLINGSMDELSITLWGIKTTFFINELQFYRGKNVVLIVTGLVLKKKYGKENLASTTATNFEFNPRFEAASHLSAEVANLVGDFICEVPSAPPFQGGATLKNKPPYRTLQQLVTETLWKHQKFRCTVTLMEVLVDEHQTSFICDGCKGIVITSQENPPCLQCGLSNSGTNQKRLIPTFVTDGELWAKPLLRGKALKQLTGMHVNDYIKYYSMVKDKYTVPTRLEKIRGATCTIKVEVIPSNNSNTSGNIVVKEICSYTHLINDATLTGDAELCATTKPNSKFKQYK